MAAKKDKKKKVRPTTKRIEVNRTYATVAGTPRHKRKPTPEPKSEVEQVLADSRFPFFVPKEIELEYPIKPRIGEYKSCDTVYIEKRTWVDNVLAFIAGAAVTYILVLLIN